MIKENINNSAMDKKESQIVHRYKLGYFSVYNPQKKYLIHATYNKKINIKSYVILSTIVLISVIILMFGCMEQFIVFLGALAFSTILFKISSRYMTKFTGKGYNS